MKAYQVITNPKVIDKIHHGLTFASDALVNARIKQKYGLYTYLTHCDEINQTIIQNTADEWSDYTNELIKTVGWTSDMKILDYDPISNYDRHEEGKDDKTYASNVNQDTDQKPENWKVTAVEHPDEDTGRVTTLSESGYESDDMTDTNKSVVKGDITNTSTQSGIYHTDNDTSTTGEEHNDHHNWHIWGNVGVTTSQQMLQSERDLIIDVLDFYIEKFKECFNLRLESLGGIMYDM